MQSTSDLPDLLCFSHLRWNFVFQRPQHLMTRFARERRVFYYEEPVLDDGPPRLVVTRHESGVQIVVPHLPVGVSPEHARSFQRALVGQLIAREHLTDYVAWYLTPMSLEFTAHL